MNHEQPLTLHFAHANGFPAASYQTLFQQLPKEWKILSVPQFGHSSRFPVAANWQHQVTELIDYVANHADDSEPVFAVGHSFGAVISFMAACEAPSLFKGVIMLDPPLVTGAYSWLLKLLKHTPLIDKITPAALSQNRRRKWQKDTDLVAYFQAKGLFKNMDRRCVEDYVQGVMKERNGHWELGFNVDVETAIFRHVPHNLKRYAGKLQCPALLVTGQDTAVCVPPQRNSFIRANKLTHQEVQGGHMFPLEYPDIVASVISSTLGEWQYEQRKKC
ncbi:alpha/beta hydrolase [Alteromonas pelagimontana]|uniref:Alpha/beta hydrolase n=1 Tax=Alteromonas pelagimontana TaxID=1858656 RepID=A0A6M4M8E9_9ALTE|nr:alpha/beta hydrolase [Alteromonas pelagimontana]QJR79494.1 alpha/beta hydrolase [Alteromonas pelagimontana]